MAQNLNSLYSEEQSAEIRSRVQRVSEKLALREIDPGKNHRRVAPEDAPFVPPFNRFEKVQLITCFGNSKVQYLLKDEVKIYLYFKHFL